MAEPHIRGNDPGLVVHLYASGTSRIYLYFTRKTYNEASKTQVRSAPLQKKKQVCFRPASKGDNQIAGERFYQS
jgi:hypothetical protein